MIYNTINSLDYMSLFWTISGCQSHDWRIYVFLNKVGSRAPKCHQYNKNVTKGFIIAFITLYLNIYHVINKAWPRVSTTRQFYFTQKNCFLYYQIHISQIYTIRMQIRAYHMKRYVTICSYFPCFFVTYLDYIIFLLVCGNFLPTSNTRRCWNSL